MDPRAPQSRFASLKQLLEFEEYKLFELRRQQEVERSIPNGNPDLLNPDVLTCEEMVRTWTARLSILGDPAEA